MGSLIEELQNDLFARISAHPALAGVAVFLARPRSELEATQLTNDIEASLGEAGVVGRGSKVGACVIVAMPAFDTPEPNLPGPALVATIPVRVIENPLTNMGVNGTFLSAEQIALDVLHLAHLWTRGGLTMVASPNGALTVVNDFADKVSYDVRLQMRVPLEEADRVVNPKITKQTLSGDDVEITCGLVGAEIRYSVDGTYPVPADITGSTPVAAGTIYTAPISGLAPGTLVRAVAYAADNQASGLVERTTF